MMATGGAAVPLIVWCGVVLVASEQPPDSWLDGADVLAVAVWLLCVGLQLN